MEYIIWTTEYGVQSMEYRVNVIQSMEYRVWSTGYAVQGMEYRVWSTESGPDVYCCMFSTKDSVLPSIRRWWQLPGHVSCVLRFRCSIPLPANVKLPVL